MRDFSVLKTGGSVCTYADTRISHASRSVASNSMSASADGASLRSFAKTNACCVERPGITFASASSCAGSSARWMLNSPNPRDSCVFRSSATSSTIPGTSGRARRESSARRCWRSSCAPFFTSASSASSVKLPRPRSFASESRSKMSRVTRFGSSVVGRSGFLSRTSC